MERKAIIVDNTFYHVYNRGNNKQTIFLCDEDYEFFLSRLEEYSKRYSANIFVYCLMPNHYHLILSQNTGGNLPQMMGTLATSVAKRFNLKYDRVGHLFQGPYKIKQIDTKEDLVEVARYMHLNPVFAKLVKTPEKWKYSSYSKLVKKVTFNLVQDKAEGNLLTLQSGLDEFYKYLIEVFKGNAAEYFRFVQEDCMDKVLDIENKLFRNE